MGNKKLLHNIIKVAKVITGLIAMSVLMQSLSWIYGENRAYEFIRYIHNSVWSACKSAVEIVESAVYAEKQLI